jgi:hypothetical protein
MYVKQAGRGKKTVSDSANMRSEEIRFLIDQKVSYINSTVNISMLWWVSSIAFCGYVLYTVWSHKKELGPPYFILGFGIVFFIFSFFISYFGFLLAYRAGVVQGEIADLADKLNSANELDIKGKFFRAEILSFQISMRIGAFSFALAFVVWDVYWFLLLLESSCFWAILCLFWDGVWVFLWIKRRFFLRWKWVKKILQLDEKIILTDSETRFP